MCRGFVVFACFICLSYSRRVQNGVTKLEEQATQPDTLATSLFAASPTIASVSAGSQANSAYTPEGGRAKPSNIRMFTSQADSDVEVLPNLQDNGPAQQDVLAEQKPKKKRKLWRLLAPGLAAMRAAPAIAEASVGTNQLGAAVGFFTNLRVPATLLTGTALGALFIDLKDHNGPKFQYLRTLYQLFAACTIALELSCVFMSTTMGVRLLAGGFDPVATSAVTFLRREFEFEYIACRLAFFTGILSFLSLIGLRIWLTFAEKQPYIARAFVFLLGSIAMFFDAFWRHTVVNYGGYFQMLRRLIYLFVFDFLPSQPLLSTLTMIGFGTASLVSFFLGFRNAHRRTKEAEAIAGSS
mmetsp:Transcript_86789/g.136926  ORF Transcript_86789/g.136926 Transcript_86789/m.136926 type:complete len:354 (-) Transcript_86789:160-1221(-)